MAKVGRPSKYDPEYCQKMLDFFGIEPTGGWVDLYDSVSGRIIGKTYDEFKVNRLPTFERFASKLGVHVDTLHEWREAHDEFSEAYDIARQYQKDILNQNALFGHYNSSYAKFVAVNCTDMVDKSSQEHSGSLTLEKIIGQSFKE